MGERKKTPGTGLPESGGEEKARKECGATSLLITFDLLFSRK
jgi:hypothetical protein